MSSSNLDIDKRIHDHKSDQKEKHQVSIAFKGIICVTDLMLQHTSYDLDSLKDFPQLEQKAIKKPQIVNVGRNLPKSSWQKVDWQHLFGVRIVVL